MPRLLSVNVGLPRDVNWRGETVHTGIWKEPVQGRRAVPRRRFMVQNRGRPGRLRCSTASWWRSAITSNSKARRLRNRQPSQEKSAVMNASMPATLRPGRIIR